MTELVEIASGVAARSHRVFAEAHRLLGNHIRHIVSLLLDALSFKRDAIGRTATPIASAS